MTRTIELLKTSEAIQLQVQDMTTTEQESTSTVQAIAKSRRKQNENTSRQQTGARSNKPHKPCRYCGRKHEFKRRHAQHLTNCAIIVTGRGTLQNNAKHQKLTTLEMSAVMMKKCSLLMQSIKAQRANLHWSHAQ